MLQADAQLQQSRERLENLRAQIDTDVRTALLNLESSSEQVTVAQSNIELAEQTLAQARDRFAAGVTDTVEVVQAQEAVASANENYISSLYSYNYAKISLARAMGLAEQGVQRILQRRTITRWHSQRNGSTPNHGAGQAGGYRKRIRRRAASAAPRSFSKPRPHARIISHHCGDCAAGRGLFRVSLFLELRIHRRRAGRWPPDAAQRAHFGLRHESECGRQPDTSRRARCWWRSIRRIIRSRWTQAEADLADAEANAQALNINVPITSVTTTSRCRLRRRTWTAPRPAFPARSSNPTRRRRNSPQAQANDVKAQNDLARYKELVGKQEISEQMYDQAVAAAKASTASVAQPEVFALLPLHSR